MTPTAAVLATVVGSALIALWFAVRFAQLEPVTKLSRAANVAVALILLHSVPALMDLVPGSSQRAVPGTLALLGIFLPALAYVFVNAIWFMKLAQARLRVG